MKKLLMKKNFSSASRGNCLIVVCGFLLLVIATMVFYTNKYVVQGGSSYIFSLDTVPQCQVILVLGAYVSPDGKASQMLDKRLEVGYELYQQGKAEKIIVSGDHGREGYDEVNAMKKYYVDKGIPSENVFMDHAGFTTYESMYRAREIFQVKKMIIVTQEFHLPRAIFIARKLGAEAYGVIASKGDYSDLIMLKNEGREIIARSKAFVATMLKNKPTFLGEAIPVTGDGRITDDKLK